MIINEKQIHELMIIARNAIEYARPDKTQRSYLQNVNNLLEIIRAQQSDDLKEIE